MRLVLIALLRAHLFFDSEIMSYKFMSLTYAQNIIVNLIYLIHSLFSINMG